MNEESLGTFAALISTSNPPMLTMSRVLRTSSAQWGVATFEHFLQDSHEGGILQGSSHPLLV